MDFLFTMWKGEVVLILTDLLELDYYHYVHFMLLFPTSQRKPHMQSQYAFSSHLCGLKFEVYLIAAF